MPTNAELAAQLLRSAAEFFRQVGLQNALLKDQMEGSAETYETAADKVENDPLGTLPDGWKS